MQAALEEARKEIDLTKSKEDVGEDIDLNESDSDHEEINELRKTKILDEEMGKRDLGTSGPSPFEEEKSNKEEDDTVSSITDIGNWVLDSDLNKFNLEGITFQQVKAKEKLTLAKRRKAAGVAKDFEKDPRPIGVGFSGGGIRSAAYCLGALHALDEKGFLPQVDYLSTVSGGGYTGTAFMTHLYDSNNKDVKSAVQSLERQMMNHCGYVVDRSNPLRIILDILLTVGMIVFLFVFGKIPGLVLAVYPMAAVFEALIDEPFYESVFGSTITKEMKEILIGLGVFSCFILLVTKVSMNMLAQTRRYKTYTALNVIRTLGFATGFCAACLLATCLFQNIWYNLFRDPNVIYMVAVVVMCSGVVFAITRMVPIEFLWLLFPIIGVFIASLTWYVRYAIGRRLFNEYDQGTNATSSLLQWDQLSDVALDQYDYYLRIFNIVWVVIFAIWNIIINYGSTALLHNFYAWRLRKAFYAKEETKIGKRTKTVYLDKDLATVATETKGGPYLLCNVTLNDYKTYPYKPSYSPFLFSPIYSGSEFVGYSESDAMRITLDKAMALSGAAFATSMGRVNISAVRTNEALFAVLGISMGDYIAFPTVINNLGPETYIPLGASAFLFTCYALGVFLFDETWRTTGSSTVSLILIAYIGYFIFFIWNLIPSKNAKGRYRMAWYSMTEHNHMLDMHTLGPIPPPYLLLSDGGHLDNISLIQLMKRRCKKIIIFDAGSDPKTTCEDLSFSLSLFKKYCNFKAITTNEKGMREYVSVHQEIKKLKQDKKDMCFIRIKISWIQDKKNDGKKKSSMLYYVKLKKHQKEPIVAKNVGLFFGSFPYISTAWQFFDYKLFNGFYEKGKQDTEALLSDMFSMQSQVDLSAPKQKLKKGESSVF